MKITKVQKLATAIASQNAIRPELSCVWTDGRTVKATDAFRAIEVINEKEEATEPVLIRARDIEKVKLMRGEEDCDYSDGVIATASGASFKVETVDASTYPDIDGIYTMHEKDERFKIKVNGRYLQEVCKILAKLDPFEKITVSIPSGKVGAMILSAQGKNHTIRAIIMPMIH